MNEKTATLAFNPRNVQQALHALRGSEPSPESQILVRDLEQFAKTLAELGCSDSADISRARARWIAQGTRCAVLERAAKVFSERHNGHPDLASALELQASALHKFAKPG